MIGVSYSDSTPAVSFAYDRGGRQKTITDAAGTRERSFNIAGALQTEQITGGILDLIQVSASFDSFLRREFLQASRGGTVLASQTYAYDPTSRLESITSDSQTATYAYYPNSGLLNTTTFTGGTNIARSYDPLGRLATITTTPGAGGPQSYTYTYNDLNQRTRVTREDGSYWSNLYNDRGELVSGKKYWVDNTPVWGNQTEYAFDNIGNRKAAKSGGNPLGQLRPSAYTANSLNQYSQRTVPGAVDVNGTATSTATVSVNDLATARKGDYFYKELAVDNSAAPVNAAINVVGARNNFGAGGEDAVTETGGSAFVPRALEAFTYDDDGNLTSDGRWNYTWDGENRLASMEAIAAVPVPAKRRLEFAYDWIGRRIQKKIYDWNQVTGSYKLEAPISFVYDGWNLMAEYGVDIPTRTYVRGQDLSGTLQGAGGTGGLLIIEEAGSSYQVGYDGNGNVAVLVDASGALVVATYDYDPFGNTVKAVGTYATENPITFGTAYSDKESGLLYYGYRYYDPRSGKWLSKDPLAEIGSLNLYSFLSNDGINSIDRLGLDGLVVAGGVSVNDPDRHDQFAWNFLNSAARRAKALVQEYRNNPRKYKDAKVYLIMYTPSYERRAQAEGRPLDYFLKFMQTAAARDGWTLVTITSAAELSYHFNKSKTREVTNIDYFGHSNADKLFLEYGSVTPRVSTDSWGGFDALNVRKEIFSVETTVRIVRGRRVVTTTPTAIFSTYGCYQGEEGGLAQQLHQIWGIITKGSIGKTDFDPIGRGETYPSSEGGFVIFR